MLEIFNTVFKYKEKQSPDQLGHYPERVHVNAMPERRYLWTSRILVIFACLSICLNMVLAATIYLLLPQRTVQPQLFQINKYFSMLEQVQPAEVDFPVSDLITEQHITEYILLRYLVSSDYDELVSRWSPGSTLYWYSSPAVFREFTENDVAYSVMQFRQKSLQRDVEIDWIKPAALGLWQVQFRTIDILPNQEKPTINIWRATMRITLFLLQKEKMLSRILSDLLFKITLWLFTVLPKLPLTILKKLKKKRKMLIKGIVPRNAKI